MNNLNHEVNREMILLYFLDVLGPQDKRRVELAIRVDQELRSYYAEQLELSWELDDFQSTIEDDSRVEPEPVIVAFPKTFIAKYQSNLKAANDRPPVLESFQTEKSVDELVWLWKPGSNDYDTIVLKFSSGHKELGDTITMLVDVDWRQGSNGDLNRSELQQVSLTRKRNSKVSKWEGELCLRPFMQDNETVESITTVQGTLNE